MAGLPYPIRLAGFGVRRPKHNPGRSFAGTVDSVGAKQHGENADDLLALKGLIEAGQIAPAIDRTYALADVAAAIRHLLDGHAQGKVVVEV